MRFLLKLRVALIFFWDRVGMNWNQAGFRVRARTQYEATRDGVWGRALQSTEVPLLCRGWPPGLRSNQGGSSPMRSPPGGGGGGGKGNPKVLGRFGGNLFFI